MKILLISTGSGSRGGGELYLLTLARALYSAGHEIHMLLPSHSRMDEFCALIPPAIKTHRLNLRNTYDRKLRQLGAVLDVASRMRCRKLINQLSPDVVHINQQVAEDGLDILLAVQSLRVPYVSTIHIPRGACELGARFGRMRDWLTERVLAGSRNQMITVSKEMQRLLSERLVSAGALNDRIHMVYTGVACEDESDGAVTRNIRLSWGVQDDVPVIGVVGRIEQQKNPFFLLELLSALKAQGKLYQAVWIGDGRLRETLQKRAEQLGLRDHLHIDGWKHDVGRRLRALDVFVLPSLFEGLPIALQQAMCAGLPVCVSDVDGMKEAVADGVNGYLCKKNNLAEWTEKLGRLLTDGPLRKSMGEKSRQLVRERFSIAAMTSETLSVYEKAIRDSRTRA